MVYFAYGSNLDRARMQERVASATAIGIARVADHRVQWNKRGADGSGKANIEPAAGHEVWGALYAIDSAHWATLDRFEPGYERFEIELAPEVSAPAPAAPCLTYRAMQVETGLRPESWYTALVLGGAAEHRLPEAYIEQLRASVPR